MVIDMHLPDNDAHNKSDTYKITCNKARLSVIRLHLIAVVAIIRVTYCNILYILFIYALCTTDCVGCTEAKVTSEG